jgi:hypothetical protein
MVRTVVKKLKFSVLEVVCCKQCKSTSSYVLSRPLAVCCATLTGRNDHAAVSDDSPATRPAQTVSMERILCDNT